MSFGQATGIPPPPTNKKKHVDSIGCSKPHCSDCEPRDVGFYLNVFGVHGITSLKDKTISGG